MLKIWSVIEIILEHRDGAFCVCYMYGSQYVRTMDTYIHPSEEAGKRFFQSYQGKGKVTMLNLLKFRDTADYSEISHLAPANPISGESAYKVYMKETLPFLNQAGGRLLFYGSSSTFLIGPDFEDWDAVLLVEHESASKFLDFAQDQGYLKISGHRTAALEDSRLLPTTGIRGNL